METTKKHYVNINNLKEGINIAAFKKENSVTDKINKEMNAFCDKIGEKGNSVITVDNNIIIFHKGSKEYKEYCNLREKLYEKLSDYLKKKDYILDKYCFTSQFEIINCCEPYIELSIYKKSSIWKQEIKSRQIKRNNKIFQKTYHRILIKRLS